MHTIPTSRKQDPISSPGVFASQLELGPSPVLNIMDLGMSAWIQTLFAFESIRDFDSQHVIENNGAEPEPEQEKKGRFQINGPLLRCLLLEGHHPLI